MAGEGGGSVTRDDHLGDQLANEPWIIGAVEREVGVAENRHQHVVEVVRHFPGHVTERFHALRALQLVLHLAVQRLGANAASDD